MWFTCTTEINLPIFLNNLKGLHWLFRYWRFISASNLSDITFCDVAPYIWNTWIGKTPFTHRKPCSSVLYRIKLTLCYYQIFRCHHFLYFSKCRFCSFHKTLTAVSKKCVAELIYGQKKSWFVNWKLWESSSNQGKKKKSYGKNSGSGFRPNSLPLFPPLRNNTK